MMKPRRSILLSVLLAGACTGPGNETGDTGGTGDQRRRTVGETPREIPEETPREPTPEKPRELTQEKPLEKPIGDAVILLVGD